jgi:predicted nucleotidyltransferase
VVDAILSGMTIAEAEALIGAVANWAVKRDDIRALALVGSWARGRPRRSSDLDLLLLSERAASYRGRRRWLREIDFGKAGFRPSSSASASYGVVWSLHLRLHPPADVELTFADCAWANTSPIDNGTRSVMTDGFRIIFDKDGTLARLVDALAVAAPLKRGPARPAH